MNKEDINHIKSIIPDSELLGSDIWTDEQLEFAMNLAYFKAKEAGVKDKDVEMCLFAEWVDDNWRKFPSCWISLDDTGTKIRTTAQLLEKFREERAKI